LLKALNRARADGGTDLSPALRLGTEQLAGLTGDRVLAIFSDGELGRVKAALAAARDARAHGIRIVVRGLGANAATALSRIATDPDDDPLIPSSGAIEAGLASMARYLTIRRKTR